MVLGLRYDSSLLFFSTFAVSNYCRRLVFDFLVLLRDVVIENLIQF